ncbi:hypothetical protein SAMN05216436_1376 [bacterium A37T11]|nr:hypothetical protein SAMN05216436_1376 [bacterium A37T11]
MSQTNSIKHQTGISPLSEPHKLVIEEALTIDEDALQEVIYNGGFRTNSSATPLGYHPLAGASLPNPNNQIYACRPGE